MGRKKLSDIVAVDVLFSSARRCCYCFGFNSDLKVKTGQIAHLDRNANNNDFGNLAWMCQEHHDAYDTKRSQTKNYQVSEAKKYRDELYALIDSKRRKVANEFELVEGDQIETKQVLSQHSIDILNTINEPIYQLAGGVMYENLLFHFKEKNKLDLHLIRLIKDNFIVNKNGVYNLLHKGKMLLYGSTL